MTAKLDADAYGSATQARSLFRRLFEAHEAVGRTLARWAEPVFNLLLRLVVAWDFF